MELRGSKLDTKSILLAVIVHRTAGITRIQVSVESEKQNQAYYLFLVFTPIPTPLSEF